MTQRATKATPLAQTVIGTPTYLGVIVATTTKSNHDTVAAFNNTGEALKGKTLLLHASAACNFTCGTANTVTSVAASDGVYLAANEKLVVTMHEDYGWIAVVGAASVKVWELI